MCSVNPDEVPLVILAAGQSSRMGKPKGLLQFGSHYWLEEHGIRFRLFSDQKMVLVLGDHAQYYQQTISELAKNFDILMNHKSFYGPFYSIQLATNHLLTLKYPAMMVLPVDVPLLCPFDATRLILNLKSSSATISLPRYRGKTGHPVVIKSELMKKLVQQPPTSRLDIEIAKLPKKQKAYLETSTPESIFNLNSKEEWNRYKSYHKRKSSL